MFKPFHSKFPISGKINWFNVCGWSPTQIYMHHHQQLDLQALIDLLAIETQEYTKALTRGVKEEIAMRRTVMESLIAEIKTRKKEDILPQNVFPAITPPKRSGTV